MTNLKPWLSMASQLAMLKQRGLMVDNDDAALDYLARIGYYRLSGYWYPLRAIDTAASAQQHRPVRSDHFVPDSHFEDVVRLYVFDKKLRMLALDALERIEMSVRVDVAHLLGQRNPCAHEEPDCLHGNFAKKAFSGGPNKGKTEHQVWLDKYNSLVYRARRESFIEHHQSKYGGKLPIWVAIEVWDFGLLSRLFAGMQHKDKTRIAQKYGLPEGRILQNWLRSLNFIRNVSAHHSRLWNINVLERSPVPAGWPELDNAKPFLYFCMMQKMMSVICPNSSWAARLTSLLNNEFPSGRTSALGLTDIGVCDEWENWLREGQK